MVSYLPLCIVFIILLATFLYLVFVSEVYMLFIWFGELAFEISGYLLGNVQRATCNLLLVFVFTLSLCLHCPCVSFCICIFFIDFVSWRAGLHSKYLVVNLLGKLPPYHILHCICSCSCMCPYICVWTCICHCICICIFSFCDGGSACIAIRVSGYLLGNLCSAMIKR